MSINSQFLRLHARKLRLQLTLILHFSSQSLNFLCHVTIKCHTAYHSGDSDFCQALGMGLSVLYNYKHWKKNHKWQLPVKCIAVTCTLHELLVAWLQVATSRTSLDAADSHQVCKSFFPEYSYKYISSFKCIKFKQEVLQDTFSCKILTTLARFRQEILGIYFLARTCRFLQDVSTGIHQRDNWWGSALTPGEPMQY